ncbi:hypothetical protein FA13DRAFT_1798183 [Coprinellus micaceus]|uniref:MINDY deubiquitinase domain-containing protein n=1 Tax=Coprinellus micaceus TaxID=71717 RepID=A0A4Y7SNM3_COPMI|nr:hypothetical protein FA13DRAFT_1798183 [Coprinellus micaceus]
MSEPEAPTVHSSVADVWGLKEIQYGPPGEKKSYKVITQNFNGPCSFIAICNILILRGEIVIEPPERKSVSYEFLSHLVAEALLLRSPEVDVSDAFSVMPLTQSAFTFSLIRFSSSSSCRHHRRYSYNGSQSKGGMDLNPVFTSPTAFRPGGSGGELKLFEQAGIKLVHGWLVDPGSQESNALERTPDYDTAAGLIAEVDHLTNGRFVSELVVEDSSQSPGPSSSSSSGPSPPVASTSSSSSSPPLATGNSQLTPEQQGKIADAIAVRDFLEHTQSQLTYHGLFQLAATLQSGELVALFRNSHLSVLLKMSSEENPFEDGGVEGGQGQVGLYTLVTDQVFLREPSVVWEKLEDVDGGWSTFVDSEFVRSSPAGGDFAGQTAEDMLKAMEIAEQQYEHMGDPNDHELARQLQQEEEWHARQQQESYLRKQKQLNELKNKSRLQDGKPKKKKSRDCVVM